VFPSARSPRRGLPLAVLLQTLISAGDGLAMVALASRVYQSSHASWAVASVFLAITVPITALAPAAGVLLDRFPVRPVLIIASVAQTLVALGLTRFTGTGATLGLAIGFGLCAAVLVPGLGMFSFGKNKAESRITGEFYLQTVEGEPNYNIHRWLEAEGAEVYPAAITLRPPFDPDNTRVR